MKYRISLSVVLFGVWLLWSGHYEALIITFGVVSCALVLGVVLRMGIADEEAAPLEVTPRILTYVPWLMWEIAKANVDVALRILRPRLPIQPRIIRVRAGQRRDLARVIYANSITLTPGTVSVSTDGDHITVHALTTDAAEGLESGKMDRRVRRLEGRG